MAKQKYYYVIAKKTNADLAAVNAQLPIFWRKQFAKDSAFCHFGYTWTDFYTIQKISVSELESIILKSKKA